MDTIKKCKITRYDDTITEPPYLTIKIDEMTVVKPEIDYLGEVFADRLDVGCSEKGYTFKFYSSCSDDENFDYEVVVY